MSDEKEIRTWALEEVEVRGGAGAPTTIHGYAAVFNSLSENLGGFRERIAPGAFKRSIPEDDIRALWEHDPQFVLGRNKSGTLALQEDARGLRVLIEPPATTWARDLMESMRRGDVNQMSFGFRVAPGGESWETVEGQQIRTLRDVRLADVSIVTYPAYTATSAEARAKAAARDQAVPAGNGEEEAGESPALLEAERARSQARRAARQRRIEIMEK